jgi:hypothetical protein
MMATVVTRTCQIVTVQMYIACIVHDVKAFGILSNVWGHAVAQLVEALRYKPEGRGFDSR